MKKKLLSIVLVLSMLCAFMLVVSNAAASDEAKLLTPAPVYTVSYDANGGSGAPSSQTVKSGDSIIIASQIPTRKGYDFLGWSTSKTALTADYTGGNSMNVTANTTLYAVWEKIPMPDTTGNKINISNEQITENTIGFNVNLKTNNELQGTLLLAIYDTNGALVDLKQYPAEAKKNISFEKQDDYDRAKILWWYDTESMYPMAEYAEVDLTDMPSISYTFDNGVVVINNTGRMVDFESAANSPFYGRADITEVIVNDTVTTIGSYSFEKCGNLKTITISPSVKSIGHGAFSGCSGLTDIYFTGSKEEWNAITVDDYNTPFINANVHFIYSITNEYDNTRGSVKITDNGSEATTAPDGDTIHLEILPNSGSMVRSVTVTDENGNNIAVEDNTFTMPKSDVHVKVIFDTAYKITTEYDNTRGTVTVMSQNTETETTVSGCTITINAVPESGYVITSLDVTDAHGGKIDVTDNTFIMPESDVNIKVVFTKEYTITKIFDSPQGSVTTTVNGAEASKAIAGDVVTVNIQPKTGYAIREFEVTDTDGNKVDLDGYNFVMPESDVTIKVVFVGILSSGACGINDTLTWTLYDNGTFTISGDGQMQDFASSDETPWSKYKDDIKIVAIKNGVTRISKNAFADCSKIKRVLIDKSVIEIETDAFKGCTDLRRVEYGAAQQDWEELYIGSGNEQIQNAEFIYNSPLTDTVQTDLDYLLYTKQEDNTITITGCLSDAAEITIPDQIEELPVTIIGENAFNGCASLTEIHIPNSITGIGNGAFSGCSSLIDLAIPSSITSIGEDAFSGCSGLTSVTIPDSVTSIGGGAFHNCSGLKDVYIADVAKWCEIDFGSSSSNPIGYVDNLYVNNVLTTDLVIPDGVASISEYAFFGCACLTSVAIPDSVASISEYAFYNCDGLTSITIPDSVTSIGEDAFYGCSNLTSVTMSKGLTTIGNEAFYYCNKLTSIEIPDSVTSIGDEAFRECSGLDSVYISDLAAYLNTDFADDTANPMYYADKLYVGGKRVAGTLEIPNGVTKIPAYAFDGCDGITSVTILDNVINSIGNNAFSGCDGLKDVYYNSSYKDVSKMSIGNYNSALTNSKIHCNDLEASKWGCDIVAWFLDDEGTLTISGTGDMRDYGYYNHVFNYTPWYDDRTNITKVVVDIGIISIGDQAFSGCRSLTSVTIPDSVTSIGDFAFYNCGGLTDVFIPGSVTSVGEAAFGDCNGIKDVYIADIAKWCEIYFYGYNSNPLYCADNLYINDILTTNLIIPDSVTRIGVYAFYGCKGLTNITIPNSVTIIGEKAFYNCTGLKTVRYCGNSDKWNDMYIGTGNNYLTNADIEYNYVME